VPARAIARIQAVSRGVRILSVTLITAGLVVLADAGLTLVWQEPISAAYGALQQARAADQLDQLESEFPTPGDVAAVQGVRGDAARARILARRFEQRTDTGDPIGRIKIDRIGLDMVMLQGTDTSTLEHGPGHYPGTPFPGEPGTVGIAGHRTTYLAPFRHIDDIRDGDEVHLELPYAAFTYRVQFHRVVDPTDVGIVNPVGYQRLVLTACHPLYSASQRWAVFARLVRVDTFAITGKEIWPTP
jgi:sortase A